MDADATPPGLVAGTQGPSPVSNQTREPEHLVRNIYSGEASGRKEIRGSKWWVLMFAAAEVS